MNMASKYIVSALSLFVSTAAVFSSHAIAQNNPTKQDIIKALLNRPEKADEITGSRSFLKKRGVTVTGGDEQPPSINLKVNFEFDSDRLETDARLTLNTLGRALADAKLKGKLIEIVGHTDAKGGLEYNDDLSNRRAAAVVNYVVSNFGVDPSLISSRGMGKRQLLDESDPLGEINRRVEIRNVTKQQ